MRFHDLARRSPALPLAAALLLATPPALAAAPQEGGAAPVAWTLSRCLEEARQNSRLRKVSRLGVAIAEAQHRQALSAYWPQASARAGYQRLDAAPDFLFPASRMEFPAGTAVVTVPGGVLGPNPVQLPVATPAQTIDVPAQHVKLADPDNVTVSVDATWLLLDGGLRRGLGEEGEGAVAMSRQDARRTDLELADGVTRLYHGAVLARQLVRLGEATLARMGATLDLTEALYKKGSGAVTRADYLDTKVMVESLRGLVADLQKNQALAEAALANTVGLPWTASIRPADEELPLEPAPADADAAVASAYRHNPDWLKLEGAVLAAEGAARVARSEHWPRLGATAGARRWWNGYGAGLATDENRLSWTVGLGLELPLFTGFASSGKVDEAEARVAQVKEQRLLLREGLGLQVRAAAIAVDAAGKASQATQAAQAAAAEAASLVERAYENGVGEADRVIRSQLTAAFATAQHLKARYDAVVARAQVRRLAGEEP